jgi:hypothetical protein
MRRVWTTALVPLALVVSGCQSAGSPQPSAAPSSAAPSSASFDLATLKIVAFMGVAPGGSGDKLAIPVFEPLLERGLQGATLPYMLLSFQDTEARASGQGAAQEFRDISNYWRDQQKVDKLKLQRFCDAMGIQGILVANLREWMQVEAPANSDEPSYTEVSAQLSIYDGATGRQVWRTRSTRTVEAEQFQGNEVATSRDDPMGSGYVGGMRTGSDAPDMVTVSTTVVEDLVEALVKGKESD